MNKLRSLYKDLDKLNRRSRFGIKLGTRGRNFLKGALVVGAVGASGLAAHAIKEKKDLYNRYKRIMNMCKESGTKIKPLHAYAMAYILIHPRKSADMLVSYAKSEKDYVLTKHAALQKINKNVELLNANMLNKFKGYNDDHVSDYIPVIPPIIEHNKWNDNTPPKITDEEMKFGADEPVEKSFLSKTWSGIKNNKGKILLGATALGGVLLANNARKVNNTANAITAANPGIPKEKAMVMAAYKHNPNITAGAVSGYYKNMSVEQAHGGIQKELNKIK